MLSQFSGLVLGVQNGQLGEHAHVGALQAQGGLQQTHQLLEVAPLLIVVVQVLQLVGVDDDVKAAHLRQTELVVVDASEANLLPGAGAGKDIVGLTQGAITLYWWRVTPVVLLCMNIYSISKNALLFRSAEF